MQDPIVEKEKDDALLKEKLLRELKLDGLVNGDEQIISHLERDLTGTSNLIPVGRNKDGSLSRYSKTLEPDDFDSFLAYTREKEKELGEQITDGQVQAAPYELNGQTGCDYCAYRDICGFDPRLDGYSYKSLVKLTREEVVGLMRKIKETGGEDTDAVD